jgi:hypothetical protein
MIQEISQSLVAQLKAKVEVVNGNVLEWSGNPKELLARPNNVPALRVVYDRTDFSDTETISQPLVQDADHRFDVIVFYRSLRDHGNEAYPLIDAVYKALDGYQTDYGTVSPAGIQLLSHEAMEFVYVVSFSIKGLTQSGFEEDDTKTTQIDFNEEEA